MAGDGSTTCPPPSNVADSWRDCRPSLLYCGHPDMAREQGRRQDVCLSLQLSHTDRNRGAVRSPGPDEHREYPCCLPHYVAPTARALPRTNGLFLLFM